MDFEHERRLTETEARSKSNTKRIDEMEKKQGDIADLVSSVKILADREVRVEKDVKEIKDDVKVNLFAKVDYLVGLTDGSFSTLGYTELVLLVHSLIQSLVFAIHNTLNSSSRLLDSLSVINLVIDLSGVDVPGPVGGIFAGL